MPVNEEPLPPEPTLGERFVPRARAVIGATPTMPVRTIVLFILIGVCLAVAPPPFNALGIAGLVLLALTRR